MPINEAVTSKATTTYSSGTVVPKKRDTTGQSSLSLRSREGTVPAREEKKEAPLFLTLRGGLTVPWSVLDWCLDLETRGVSFSVKDGRIYPTPLSTLTDADKAFLKTHRAIVLALASYQPDDSHLWRA